MSEIQKQGLWKKDKADRGLYQRGRTWYVRYADPQGRVRAERVAPSKALALKVYQKRKTEVAERRFFPSANVSFAELVHDLIVRDRQRHAQKYPGENFRTGRQQTVTDWFSDRLAASIMPQEIEKKLSAHCRTPATYNRYRVIFTAAYRLGIQNKKVVENPAHLVKQLKENNEIVRFLENEEERALRATIRQIYPQREAELDLALHTGMRWSEQYELRWADVNEKLNLITIPRAKSGQRERIPINSAARQALAKLRALDPASPLVCPNTTPKIHRIWWQRSLKEAKVRNFRWHDLRHTFASRLVMDGVDILRVNKLLRHKTLQMTMRYAHLSDKELHAAVERLATSVTKSDTRISTTNALVN